MFQDNADYNSVAASEVNKESDEQDIDKKHSLGIELCNLYNEIIKSTTKNQRSIPSYYQYRK